MRKNKKYKKSLEAKPSNGCDKNLRKRIKNRHPMSKKNRSGGPPPRGGGGGFFFGGGVFDEF
ncbi:MAG: hypothetical protein V1768_02965, partial [Patescibacteria group bacterium]